MVLHSPGSSSSAPQAGDSQVSPPCGAGVGRVLQGGFFRSAGNQEGSACSCHEQGGFFWNLGTKGNSQAPCLHFNPLNTQTVINNQIQTIPCFPGQRDNHPLHSLCCQRIPIPGSSSEPGLVDGLCPLSSRLFQPPFPGSWPLEEQEPWKVALQARGVRAGRSMEAIESFQGPSLLF